ncbi:coat protein [Gayfeather mild mottle virus]|uniref:Capsid protein n=1 Tax=Gayfeather mild mottle virus TaxID=578305 RepID=C0MNB6_9BROM|nr:coat protein [Gayfeather mild mottle virus]CAT02560.1 coat protein [Gayfeather mild mottle virus]
MAQSGTGGSSRRPRRGRRNNNNRNNDRDKALRDLTVQVKRLAIIAASTAPSLQHPTFIASQRCRPGYTYTSLDVRPTKTEKGHSFGQRLTIPVPVSDYPKKKVSCVQVRLNPSPKFDSTIWVSLRRLDETTILTSENVFKLFTDGAASVLIYQHVTTGVQPNNKITFDMSNVDAEIGDMNRYALIVYSKDDVLEADEMVIHVDVEHQRIPSATSLPV